MKNARIKTQNTSRGKRGLAALAAFVNLVERQGNRRMSKAQRDQHPGATVMQRERGPEVGRRMAAAMGRAQRRMLKRMEGRS